MLRRTEHVSVPMLSSLQAGIHIVALEDVVLGEAISMFATRHVVPRKLYKLLIMYLFAPVSRDAVLSAVSIARKVFAPPAS
jgi:hypothetical protein